MKKIWHDLGWIAVTIGGSALFAAGFSLFLQPNDLNSGGISGLAMVLVELLGFGSVGSLSIVVNLPLFVLGGLKIGKKFFTGSLIGMLFSSVLIDVFALVPMPPTEPLIGALYGGVICGFGLGVVFVCGSSTGGSDILARAEQHEAEVPQCPHRADHHGLRRLCGDSHGTGVSGRVQGPVHRGDGVHHRQDD